MKLGQHGVGLVHYHQEVLWEIVYQSVWLLPGLEAGKMSCIVLDPTTGAYLSEHLQIVPGALLDPLGLQKFAPVLEPLDAFLQLKFDVPKGSLHVGVGGDVVGGRVDGNMIPEPKDLPGHWVHLLDGIHLVAEKFHPYR